MARTGRELAIGHGPQLPAHGLLGDRDPELLPDPGDQIDETPAHHAVNRRDRARVDPGRQARAMRIGELGRLAGRLAVDQARGSIERRINQEPYAIAVLKIGAVSRALPTRIIRTII